jgi:hypothetical protein
MVSVRALDVREHRDHALTTSTAYAGIGALAHVIESRTAVRGRPVLSASEPKMRGG